MTPGIERLLCRLREEEIEADPIRWARELPSWAKTSIESEFNVRLLDVEIPHLELEVVIFQNDVSRKYVVCTIDAYGGGHCGQYATYGEALNDARSYIDAKRA